MTKKAMLKYLNICLITALIAVGLYAYWFVTGFTGGPAADEVVWVSYDETMWFYKNVGQIITDDGIRDIYISLLGAGIFAIEDCHVKYVEDAYDENGVRRDDYDLPVNSIYSGVLQHTNFFRTKCEINCGEMSLQFNSYSFDEFAEEFPQFEFYTHVEYHHEKLADTHPE